MAVFLLRNTVDTSIILFLMFIKCQEKQNDICVLTVFFKRKAVYIYLL